MVSLRKLRVKLGLRCPKPQKLNISFFSYTSFNRRIVFAGSQCCESIYLYATLLRPGVNLTLSIFFPASSGEMTARADIV